MSHSPPPRQPRRTALPFWLGGALAVVLATLPMAQACAETLQDAIAAAYETNPTLRRTRFQLNGINENYVQARAAYGPTLSITGQAQVSNNRLPTTAFNQNLNQGQATVTLRQPLYTGGQARGQLAQQRANVLSGQQTLRQTEQQMIQTVIAAYAAVLRDQERIKVGSENVRVLQEQLDQNRARLQEQDVTATDVAQSESRLADSETQLAALLATLDISRSQYLQVVGHNPGTLAPLPDLPGMPTSSDEAYQRAEDNNPALLASKYTEQGSSAAVAAARGAGKPNVALTAQAGYLGQLTPFDGRAYQRNLVAGVSVTQPLFNSGAIRSRIRQAAANNDADQASIDAARRTALQSVTSAWSQLYAARVGLAAGTRQVEFAQIAFAGMRHEELAGYRATIETLNAEQELANAQLTLLANRYNEYVARAALLAAIGDLTVDKLVPDVPVHDPEAEFRKVRNRGRTPLEPVAQAIDRIGAAGLRRPLSADLTGADVPPSTTMPPLAPTPGPALTRGPLVPITASPLVPVSDLPPADRSLNPTAPVARPPGTGNGR